jgi:hypothetical protein
VLSASVTVDKQLISSVGKGILVFAAVANGDTEKDADALAAKILKMRLWDDEAGGRVCAWLPLYILSALNEISDGLAVEDECSRYPWGGFVWYLKRFSYFIMISLVASFSVHLTRFNKEGIQAGFPRRRRRRTGESALPTLFLAGSARI